MVKTLTDRFKISKVNRGKKLGLLGAVLFNLGTLMGCPSPIDTIPKPEQNNPTASLTISPTSGKAPLQTKLYLNGSDADGDISKSYIFADYDGDGSMDAGEELALANSDKINQDYTFTKNGTFKVYGQCKDSAGNIGTSSPVTMTIQPSDTPTEPTNPTVKYTVSGNLQDNETDSNRNGEVKCYVDGVEYSIDSDGNDFSFEVPENSEVILEGRMKDGTTDKSYKRTIRFNDIVENKNVNLRCVPYDNPNNSYDDGLISTTQKIADFKTHMGRVNFNGLNGLELPMVTGNMNSGLKKWNYGQVAEQLGCPIFKGIEVNSDDFKDYNQYITIQNKIRNSGHIHANEIADKITYGKVHQGEKGYGNIRRKPEGESPGTITMDEIWEDGYIEKYIVYLDPDYLDDPTTTHEILGHGHLFPGHADKDIEGNEKFPSHMTHTSKNRTSTFSSADIKASYIVDEPTYSGMESIEDILG